MDGGSFLLWLAWAGFGSFLAWLLWTKYRPVVLSVPAPALEAEAKTPAAPPAAAYPATVDNARSHA